MLSHTLSSSSSLSLSVCLSFARQAYSYFSLCSVPPDHRIVHTVTSAAEKTLLTLYSSARNELQRLKRAGLEPYCKIKAV